MGANNARAFPAKKTQVNVDLSAHVTLQVQITRFTGMRILHNYRNISRATKQFMLGDRFFEQLMILTLREHFFRPMMYKAPIENTYFMVSHDRDHPIKPMLTKDLIDLYRDVPWLTLLTVTTLSSPTTSTLCSFQLTLSTTAFCRPCTVTRPKLKRPARTLML